MATTHVKVLFTIGSSKFELFGYQNGVMNKSRVRTKRHWWTVGSVVLLSVVLWLTWFWPLCKKMKAVAIAKSELSTRGWNEMKVAHVQNVNGGWEILICRLPTTPDGFVLVTVSNDFKVLSVMPPM